MILDGYKKLTVILATILLHGVVALGAKYGFNLSPAEQATVLEFLSASVTLCVSMYLHSQGKVDVAKAMAGFKPQKDGTYVPDP
jgi:hypothetical protein